MRTLELLDQLTKVIFDEEIAGHVPHQLLCDIKHHMLAYLPKEDDRYWKIQAKAAEDHEEEGSVHIEHDGTVEVIDGEDKGAWVEACVWVSLDEEL